MSTVFAVQVVAETLLDDLISACGLSVQLAQMPELVKAGVQQGADQGVAFTEQEMEQVLAGVDEHFIPERMQAEMTSTIRPLLSAGEIEELLAWYRSPLGRQITQLEEQASSAEALAAIMERADELLKDEKRVAIAKELDKAMGATDISLEMQKSTALAVFAAMAKKMAPGNAVNLEGYAKQIDAMSPQLRAGTEQLVVLSFVYTYENVDDENLNRYQRTLANPVFQKFNEALGDALVDSMAKSVTLWVEELPAILDPQAGGQASSV
ncbi:MAG: DUF2059 domain-containing protein [Pseudomonadota bacterium]